MRLTAAKMVAVVSLAAAFAGFSAAGTACAHQPGPGARPSVVADATPSAPSTVSPANDPWD